jgi:hypothetical protein
MLQNSGHYAGAHSLTFQGHSAWMGYHLEVVMVTMRALQTEKRKLAARLTKERGGGGGGAKNG